MYNFELKDPSFLPHAGCEIEFSLKSSHGQLLVGENGVGKTTLLHRIWKQLSTESSVVLVEQRPLDYFYDRKVGEIKKILLGMGQKNSLIDVWNTLGLHEKEDRFFSTLSGGENQTVKLATSLCLKASYYLLDEPSQFLDQIRKKKLTEILNQKIDEGSSVLIVEHNAQWLPQGFSVMEMISTDGWVKKGKTWIT